MSTERIDDVAAADDRTSAAEERYYMASSWTLIRRRFLKHKLALVGGVVLLVIYFLAIFAGFFSVAAPFDRHEDHLFAPPTRIRVLHEGRLHRPFVYGLTTGRDPVTRARVFENDPEQIYPLKFFVTGPEYRWLGLIPSRVHFVGVDEPGVLFLFGTESPGRDMFSRVLQGARISLSIGLVGIVISFFLGCLLGGLSGYFGGWVDMAIQRTIEFMQSLPTIPLWMGLAAAVPIAWPQARTYFMITIILSILGWTGLARVVRGKLLQLREEDYVMAAKVYGASDMRIIHPPPAAGPHELPDRAPHPGRPLHDPGQDGALVPRPGPAGAGDQLGGDAAAGPERAHRVAAAVAAHPGPVRGDRGALFQLPRRRPPRRGRSLQVIPF